MIEPQLTEEQKKKIEKASDKEICSILNLGYNGHPKYWFYAKSEAEKRRIYFKQFK